MKTILLVLVGLAAPVLADDELANTPYVAADRYGRCYAKSVPAGSYGEAGTTRVYWVTAGQDRPIDTYRWYSGRIHLQCNTRMPDGQYATAVVQMGPWARGQQASADHLAFAFYARGRLVQSYSTLDIAGSPERVSASVSHYTVIREVEGFVSTGAEEPVFRLVTVDGRRLTFDPASGALTRTDGP